MEDRISQAQYHELSARGRAALRRWASDSDRPILLTIGDMLAILLAVRGPGGNRTYHREDATIFSRFDQAVIAPGFVIGWIEDKSLKDALWREVKQVLES